MVDVAGFHLGCGLGYSGCADDRVRIIRAITAAPDLRAADRAVHLGPRRDLVVRSFLEHPALLHRSDWQTVGLAAADLSFRALKARTKCVYRLPGVLYGIVDGIVAVLSQPAPRLQRGTSDRFSI